MSTDTNTIEALANREYKYGFVTEIESDADFLALIKEKTKIWPSTPWSPQISPRHSIPLNLESSPPSPACTSFPFESNAPPCRGTPCVPRLRAGRRPFRRSRRWTPLP